MAGDGRAGLAVAQFNGRQSLPGIFFTNQNCWNCLCKLFGLLGEGGQERINHTRNAAAPEQRKIIRFALRIARRVAKKRSKAARGRLVLNRL